MSHYTDEELLRELQRRAKERGASAEEIVAKMIQAYIESGGSEEGWRRADAMKRRLRRDTRE